MPPVPPTTAAIPLRSPPSSRNRDEDEPEARGLLGGDREQADDVNDAEEEEDTSWLQDEQQSEETVLRSLKRARERTSRLRAYREADRRVWLSASLTSKRWYPLARAAFLAVLGAAALGLSLFSLRALVHAATSHAPGAPASSSHPPKDRARWAASLLPEHQLSNGTHPWRKTVILVSLDGVKPQYLAEGKLPRLVELGLDPPSPSSSTSAGAAAGLLAAYMQPRFPTLTFPNHWTLLTGLNVESHGIVANDFFLPPPHLAPPSPRAGRHFVYTDPLRSHDPAWWAGTPLWATAERSGVPSAVLMWPGPPRTSEGDRPAHFVEYDGSWSTERRVDKVAEWLDMGIKKRPQLMCGEWPL